jgi:plastocyanin
MNRNARRLVAGLGVLALGGVACGADETATQNASEKATGADGGSSITIKLIAFNPTQLNVPVGATVTWRQDDVASHTVTSGRVEQSGGTATAKPDSKFDSGTISKGQNFEFKFAEAGEFPFYCAVHPATMTGVVTVK